MFYDRQDAGKRLAQKLQKYRGSDAIVLALPRGGVVLGYEIARELRLPLDTISVRKIGHPSNPEYALCAVDERGMRLCNEEEVALMDHDWLATETRRQIKEAKRRASLYRADREPFMLKNKVAIIVDDGIATGFTVRVAVLVVKKQKPTKVVIAVPVISEDLYRELKEGVDELITLTPPEEFLGAVGSHYAHFDQVQDSEVIRLLESARKFSHQANFRNL